MAQSSDQRLIISIEDYYRQCFVHFPEGTRFLILTAAHTLGPGEISEHTEVVRDGNYKRKIHWRVRRYHYYDGYRCGVEFALGECCFWNNDISKLPEYLK